MNDFAFAYPKFGDWTSSTATLPLPEGVRDMVEDAVDKSKKTLTRSSDTLKEVYDAQEEVMEDSRKDIAKVTFAGVENFVANTEATLDLTAALVTAKSPQEMLELQTRFWQEQSKHWARQASETSKMAQELAAKSMSCYGDLTRKMMSAANEK